jgi:preprotein translocase subunit Sss1
MCISIVEDNIIKITRLETQMNTVNQKLDCLDKKFDTFQGSINDTLDQGLKDMQAMMENYTRKEEFLPVQKITYGLVGLILTGVIGAILALVLKQ